MSGALANRVRRIERQCLPEHSLSTHRLYLDVWHAADESADDAALREWVSLAQVGTVPLALPAALEHVRSAIREPVTLADMRGIRCIKLPQDYPHAPYASGATLYAASLEQRGNGWRAIFRQARERLARVKALAGNC